MTAHACAVPDCDKTAPLGLLMCRRHWYAVPKPAQREVWRTWKLLLSGGHGMRPVYEAAVKVAVDAVTTRQQPARPQLGLDFGGGG
jgi:hypothetical protein